MSELMESLYSRPAEPQPPRPRKIKTVPFVELYRDRLQGVASSDSDIERVYCAFITAVTGEHYSSTNNDRPDAGTAKRIRYLVDEAYAQYGEARVRRFLQLAQDPRSRLGPQRRAPASEVFSRFLNYLKFLDRQIADPAIPEMAWFLE
ncbi:hypothetical protein [Tuwongella immobilis]|uniref:Uncharacterized protein n=1 Tax=Tuwongella immobilis TaxID=692036 RepID=A0A6C2YPH1_9BACT|nr:hypothetical protein [Tuwongella immobilis]VIP03356.1 Uncharacterized protein OS=bacterium UASB14 GN=U14_02386 PE=4 SV=1 [Tuwongella immobilis]VTS04084.1 Uncharacterized protein OS=bacterium UASB14 GN=U14_02386 PE=4 SV=1 [Tuwongella immobilis]